METLPQDVFNLIIGQLQRQDLIELSCASLSINTMFNVESLWLVLLSKDYPNVQIDTKKSWYEMYFSEYYNHNRKTYMGVYYNTEDCDGSVDNYKGCKNRSDLFLTLDEAIEWLWKTGLSWRGIFKSYYQLKPQLARLVKVFGHLCILNICNSDDAVQKLRNICVEGEDQENFLYDEDITYQECLDLMEDYLAEFLRYKDIICDILKQTRSINRKTGICGWDVYKIHEQRGIYPDERGDDYDLWLDDL